MAHLFTDISSHGLGHLAQVAPVLNALRAVKPDIKLTIRSSLPRERLALRIDGNFDHVHAASDFGFVMKNALDIDLAASATRYREFHADWPRRVRREADWLAALAPDAVFSDVAYLPLAGAAKAGIPSLALCSLNWADLVMYYFHAEPWLRALHADAVAAYGSARAFLRTTPGMPMLDLPNVVIIGPVAKRRQVNRTDLARRYSLPMDKRWVLVALGGFDFPLPVADWPRRDDVLWLQPSAEMPFGDLLTVADAVITKPGYGTFVEAAVHGVPLLYLRRPDWPEELPLLDWLHNHARAAEISRTRARNGDLLPTLDALWARPAPAYPEPTGVAQARDYLLALLDSRS
jgi:hypothetical protein